MLHSIFVPAQPLVGPAAPLTPAAYLKLRRNAARLSIEDVAERLAPKSRDRRAACDLIRLLETDGSRAVGDAVLHELRRAFRFDLSAYRQLADLPAYAHPQICRTCGCSWDDPCVDDSECCCSWSTADRCTACASADQ